MGILCYRTVATHTRIFAKGNHLHAPREYRRPFHLGLLFFVPTIAVALICGALLLPEALSSSSGVQPVDPAQDAVQVAPAPDLEAPVGFDPYIFRPTGERADPVNLIFLHTDALTIAKTIERLLGWKPVTASNMTFRRGERQRPTARQLIVDVSPTSRYHIRIQAVPVSDTQTYVLASVHRDDTVACGHVGRAFDETRDLVARAFIDAGFPARMIDLDNFASGSHCDGSRVPGDGRAVLVDLSRAPRAEPTRYRVIGAE